MKTRLRSLTMRQRLLLVPLIALPGLLLLQGTNIYFDNAVNEHVVLPNIENSLIEGHKTVLKALVENEVKVIAHRIETLPPREKMATIIAETDLHRFFDDRSGYFFVYDTAGTRINQPTNKSANGKNFLAAADSDGFRYIAGLIDKAKSGGGFVRYRYEKPGSGVQPKMSYTMMIPGTNFILGAGVYIDNVAAARSALTAKIAAEKRKYTVYLVLVVVLLLCAIGSVTLLVSRSVAQAVRGSVMQILDGSQQVGSASGQL